MATLSQTNQPVNSGAVANGSYTVPSGKYARVVASLTTTATATGSGTGALYGISGTVGSNSSSLEMWLRSGEVITISNTTASGGYSKTAHTTGTSIAVLSIGGTAVCRSVATAHGGYGAGNGTDLPAGTISGSSNVNFRYEEFNNTF